MSFLKEIKDQPQYVRELMFGLCVMITVSAVGLVWYSSFEEEVFVALNPEPDRQAAFFAARQDRDGESENMFATIGSVFGNLKAAIFEVGNVFDGDSGQKDKPQKQYEFPLSGGK